MQIFQGYCVALSLNSLIESQRKVPAGFKSPAYRVMQHAALDIIYIGSLRTEYCSVLRHIHTYLRPRVRPEPWVAEARQAGMGALPW